MPRKKKPVEPVTEYTIRVQRGNFHADVGENKVTVWQAGSFGTGTIDVTNLEEFGKFMAEVDMVHRSVKRMNAENRGEGVPSE